MTKFGKIVSLVALTGLCVLVMPVAAAADELEALCKVANPIDGADKICKCVSDKITGADRAGAIKAMKVWTDAMVKGEGVDTSAWTHDMVKGLTTFQNAQTKCFE
jgi:hypothetical protein